MITLWDPTGRSVAVRRVVEEIQRQGVDARMSRVYCPGAIPWGLGGGNKYHELQTLAAAGVPVPPHSHTKYPGWLARTYRHHAANDLLRGLPIGDYYVQYVPTIREHRVHVIENRVIRVQRKVAIRVDAHPKFRSSKAGWELHAASIHTTTLPPGAHDFAQRAVASLHYAFGAVDVGTTEQGDALVFEVNTAPGLKGDSVHAYAQAFIQTYASS